MSHLNRMLIIASLLLFEGAQGAPVPGGNGVDGGGDPFYQRMQRLRDVSVERLRAMDATWLSEADKETSHGKFLSATSWEAMANDLEASAIVLRPNETDKMPNPNFKCAQTTQQATAAIWSP